MSAHHPKHLHEFLSQDQEPFLLLRQLHPPSRHNTRRRRRLSFPSLYDFSLKRLGFVPSHNPANPPLFELPSAASPPRSPRHRAAVSLLVPVRTTALLLEAAKRIHGSGSARATRKQSFGGRVVGLVMKRFARRKSKFANFGQNGDNEPSYVEPPSGAYNRGIVISDVKGNGTVCDGDSRDSSFRGETQVCSRPEGRLPELPSPPASTKHANEANEGETNRGSDACRASEGKNVDDDEEERQQFSPVSVLDPPFEVEVDNEDGDNSPVLSCEDGDHDRVDAGFDYDCSFAFVQRTKQQLLDKLQRFERLARLDPIELEKRMLDSDDDEAEADHEDHLALSFSCLRKSPEAISKMAEDLVPEEERNSIPRHPKNSKSMEPREEDEEKSRTIDMIVDGELRARWEPGEEQFGLLAGEIEVGMFELLLEELTTEDDPNSCQGHGSGLVSPE